MDNKFDSPGQICAAVEAACGALAGHRGLLDWAQRLCRQLETALGLPAVPGERFESASQTKTPHGETAAPAAQAARCSATQASVPPRTDAAIPAAPAVALPRTDAAIPAAPAVALPRTAPDFPAAPAVALPPIPQLAQGAVLPPNRPFLAVVGDQHSGVNVEAPLDIIRQAVSVETEGQTAAIVAGLEASIGVQREILEAVQGIELGDETIGRAVSRYDRRNAIMLGGDSL